jgi:serine/threonine protein kinase
MTAPSQQQQQQQQCKKSSSSALPHPQRRTKNTWWHKSVVSRTVSFVEHDFEQIVAQSPFLQQAEPGKHIALFHRSEIMTGKLLGRGGFSDVYEITAFQLNEQLHSRLTVQQRQLRQRYQRLAMNTATGQGRYAIKHLQEGLLQSGDSSASSKAFQHAASDLAVEAAYLSALDHQHIITVRGLPVEGLHALANGRHDGYFIILDRVDETLHDRMEQQWKQQDTTVSDASSLQEQGEYALQLASAISYLHERRIIFRDLKPHNVGFSGGSLKLFDFGVCRELPPPSASCACTDSKSKKNSEQGGGGFREEIYTMSGVGTRRYMATEIFNTSQYNDKADVYSWSMILYEMLELNKPYASYSVQDHTRYVCGNGERPVLVKLKKQGGGVLQQRLCQLLEQSWCESIVDRLSMKEAQWQLRNILDSSYSSSSAQKNAGSAPASPVGVDDDELFISVPSISMMLPHGHFLQVPSFSSTATTNDDDDDDDLSDVALSFKLLNMSSHQKEEEDGKQVPQQRRRPVMISYRAQAA